MSGAAVVLAAGRGMRLRPHTDGTPKALIPVAGIPVLTRIMQALRDASQVTHFAVATGYAAESFDTFSVPAKCDVTWVRNANWANSNSMLSLSLCMPHLRNGGYIVEGDCCFDARLPGIAHASDSWFVRPFVDDDGCCLRTDDRGIIRSLSIEEKGKVRPDAHSWKSCGVLYLTAETARKAERWLSEAVEQKREKQYYDLIFADHLAEVEIHAVDIGSSPWYEIDNEGDLQRAEKLFG